MSEPVKDKSASQRHGKLAVEALNKASKASNMNDFHDAMEDHHHHMEMHHYFMGTKASKYPSDYHGEMAKFHRTLINKSVKWFHENL